MLFFKKKTKSKPIEDLDLNKKVYGILKREGVNTTEDINKLSDEQLKSFSGIGPAAIKEIRKKVIEKC